MLGPKDQRDTYNTSENKNMRIENHRINTVKKKGILSNRETSNVITVRNGVYFHVYKKPIIFSKKYPKDWAIRFTM